MKTIARVILVILVGGFLALKSDANPASLRDQAHGNAVLVSNDYPECEGEEVIHPLTGTCMIILMFYVANYPEDCPQDVGCLPLAEKPDGVPANPDEG